MLSLLHLFEVHSMLLTINVVGILVPSYSPFEPLCFPIPIDHFASQSLQHFNIDNYRSIYYIVDDEAEYLKHRNNIPQGLLNFPENILLPMHAMSAEISCAYFRYAQADSAAHDPQLCHQRGSTSVGTQEENLYDPIKLMILIYLC